MRKYRVLVLTDHKNHTVENSVYAMLNQMIQHEKCSSVYIASRAKSVNDSFFKDLNFSSLFAHIVDESFKYSEEGAFFLQNIENVKPTDFDIIFLRLPRPVSDEFLTKLKIEFPNTYFVNDPMGIIKCSSKAYLLRFPDLCPPMRICSSVEEILNFSKQYDLVLKPLREYGGRGILKITGNIISDGKLEYDLKSYLVNIESYIIKESYLAMKFLKNVKQGDKRIIVVDGEIMAASLRMPPDNSWLCNVALGGRSIESEANAEEINLIKEIEKPLRDEGILIYGVDTLVDDNNKRILSEINTLSVGGFPQAEQQIGKPIIQLTLNKIFANAGQKV